MNINPKKEHGIVSCVTNSQFEFHGRPSICRDEKGTLYVVASGFRRGYIVPDGKTVMYISHDEGKKWSPPIVINDSYLDDRDAGILYMGNGRMLVTWFSHSAEFYEKDRANECAQIPKEHSVGGSYIKVSEDYGFTWSEPIRLPGAAPHGPNMLKDGTLIYLAKDMYREDGHLSMDGYELHTIHTGYSDLGYPCSVELDDGSIFTVYYQQLEGDIPCCLQYTR